MNEGNPKFISFFPKFSQQPIYFRFPCTQKLKMGPLCRSSLWKVLHLRRRPPRPIQIFCLGWIKGSLRLPREIAGSNASTHGSRCASQGLFNEIGSRIGGSPCCWRSRGVPRGLPEANPNGTIVWWHNGWFNGQIPFCKLQRGSMHLSCNKSFLYFSLEDKAFLKG